MNTTGPPTISPAVRESLLREAAKADRSFRVIVAGGGVAALEAVLALAEAGSGSLDVRLVCPEPSFSLRALSVAQPFGGDAPRTLDLEEFCAEHHAGYSRDAVSEVWGEQQRVLADSGEEHFYDALLLATGTRQRDALPGAVAFRGARDSERIATVLERLESGSLRHLTFAVPGTIRWSLPLYELALLTAHRLGDRAGGVEIKFVTHEPAPLEVFGAEASERIAGLLESAGIELIRGRTPVSFDDDVLTCVDGPDIDTGFVVTLPELVVPVMPGVPQGRRGFIGCDPQMRVDGLRSVWVAGDASWMPVKQGGLAAQQAEVAASGIAVAAGLDVEEQTFRPVIRAALLTGEATQFLRAEPGEGEGELSASPIWWPPIKVAAPRLAPYLAAKWQGEGMPAPAELEDLQRDVPAWESAEEHREALRVALSYADVHAREAEFADALRWLDVAERLNVALPFEYVERRREWRRRAEGSIDASAGGMR